METGDAVEESAEGDGTCFLDMQFSKVDHTTQLVVGQLCQLLVRHCLIVNTDKLYQNIVRCMLQCSRGVGDRDMLSPGIHPCCLANHIKVIVYENGVLPCNKVGPLPCLAAQECKA